MTYWVISDTHFGHEACKEWCGRPDDFEDKIFNYMASFIEPEDILIHLGDVAFYNEKQWHRWLRSEVHGKHWLVKGNHDKRSDIWYLNNGWEYVSNINGDKVIVRIPY